MNHPKKELRRLAFGWAEGKVFTTADVPRDMVPMVFFPLMAMAGGAVEDEDGSKVEDPLAGVVEIYGEDRHAIGTRGINGYPMLGRIGTMNARDLKLFRRYQRRALIARDGLITFLRNRRKALKAAKQAAARQRAEDKHRDEWEKAAAAAAIQFGGQQG